MIKFNEKNLRECFPGLDLFEGAIDRYIGLDLYGPKYEKALDELNKILEGHGVEYDSLFNVEYINMGDTYNTTVMVLLHDDNHGPIPVIGCLGDLHKKCPVVVDGCNGIYRAQVFAERYPKTCEYYVGAEGRQELLDGPDNECYEDTFEELNQWCDRLVLDNHHLDIRLWCRYGSLFENDLRKIQFDGE